MADCALNSVHQSVNPITQLPNYPIDLCHITTPPPTRIVCPVRNVAAGDARNTAAPATSSGTPQRLSGVDSTTVRRHPSLAPAPKVVSIKPGAMTFTRTRGATERASDLLNASTPPFTAE